MRLLISGGLGHIGCNYAAHNLAQGIEVVILDNYSAGLSCRYNELWLKQIAAKHKTKLFIVPGDVAVWDELERVFDVYRTYDRVLHAAASPRFDVRTDDPKTSFASNTIGMFTLLESLRGSCPEASVINLSAHKIYDTSSWSIEIAGSRYRWIGHRVGPSETFPLTVDSKEPEGASKLAALQYARCYASLYGMPVVTVVPSGVCGPRLFGQSGLISQPVIATELKLPMTIYGDGFQVRDLCHTDDLCVAFDLLFDKADSLAGEVFNVGGGPRNAISLIELLTKISLINNKFPAGIKYVDWFPGSAKLYISNIEKMIGLGWVPRIPVEEAIRKQVEWVQSEELTLRRLYGVETPHVGVHEDPGNQAAGV